MGSSRHRDRGSRDRDRDKYRERDRDRDRDRDHERTRERRGDRSDKRRGSRDRERDRERDRGRDRHRERDRDNERRDRDKRSRSKSKEKRNKSKEKTPPEPDGQKLVEQTLATIAATRNFASLVTQKSEEALIGSPSDEDARARRRRSRWGGSEHEKIFIPGMPTILPSNLNKDQEQAYLLQLQIEEVSRKLRSGDLGIPANPEERCCRQATRFKVVIHQSP